MNLTFRPIWEYGSFSPEKKKTKLGRYHGSVFPNVETTQYPIAVYIDGDIQGLKQQQKLTEEQIIDQFLSELNSQVIGTGKTKTNKNKKKNPKFGYLTKYSYCFKVDDTGKEYILAILLTNDRKNKNFWGEGTLKHG
jgi:hypothetical protein